MAKSSFLDLTIVKINVCLQLNNEKNEFYDISYNRGAHHKKLFEKKLKNT